MSRLGCVRDKFDERDYLMRPYLPVVKLPKKVDYTNKMSPVRDQQTEGTCVGFAVLRKNSSESISLSHLQSPKSYTALLHTELKIIKREDKNNSIIQDFLFFTLHQLNFVLHYYYAKILARSAYKTRS